jgi:hypothetical protein
MNDALPILIPAALTDSLTWEKELLLGQKAHAEGQRLLWQIDLGLPKHAFRPDDTATFYAFSLALEEFTKAIYLLLKEATCGILLYQGSSDFRQHVPLPLWEEALGAAPSLQEHALFGAQILSEYLQRLISFLPEEVPIFASFDTSQETSWSQTAQKLSQARFESVQLLVEGPAKVLYKTPDAPLGISLPLDSYFDAKTHAQLDELLSELISKNEPFRLIPEEKLTEEWNGLDTLIALSHTISSQGRRKLSGFAAAGGEIILK